MAQPVANVPTPVGPQFEFTSEVDGLRLHAYHWRAVGDTIGLVVISHGAAEHAGRYARFAKALAKEGFETWALDHRGHGRSPGPKGLGDTGRGGWNGIVADLTQLVRMARAVRPNLPLVLFGHSMGSFVAQQFCAEHSDLIDAVVLSGSTAFDLPDDMKELPEIDFNAGFEPARTPYDWLSRDEAEVDKYVADPLCGFSAVAPAYDIDSLRHLSSPETMKHIRNDLPVLLVSGDKDPLAVALLAIHRLEEKLREAGVQHVDSRFYEGARHELLNEINRDDVTRDITTWLHNVVNSEAVRTSYIRPRSSDAEDKALSKP